LNAEKPLEEYRVVLVVRSADGDPYKWDFTDLLDLNTGQGEQAWVEDSTLLRMGTEKELEA
jgi:hypothetical protein